MAIEYTDRISESLRKKVASLDTPRHRRQEGLFKAEGTKCVIDTMDHFEIRFITATSKWLETYDLTLPYDKVYVASPADMERMSHLSTPPQVIAVYEIPDVKFDMSEAARNLVIALDGVQDPGNLGTIVRVADWFGITDIICSGDCADIYGPKAVMATMGALSRVRVHQCNLEDVLEEISRIAPVYGTFLDGDNIFDTTLPANGVIVMGNEGKGISSTVAKLVTRRLKIPSYPADRPTSESLNVAMACSITVAEFRSRCFNK